jgi:hypothetical protein
VNTSIITIAYDKDLEFLKYNLRSIKKFCKGYINNIVIVDDHNEDCQKTIKYLKKINQPYYIDVEAKIVENGYVRQQYIKFQADKYVPNDCDFICHVDCDSLFKREHDPEVYFKNGKPIILKSSYKSIYERLKKRRSPKKARKDIKALKKWKETTSELVGFNVDYEYMQAMPFVYPVETQKRAREYLEKIHSKSLIDIIKNKKIISEFNILGAYCDKFEKENFFFMDRDECESFKDFIKKRRSFFAQYSSRKISQPERYVDLSEKDNILDKIIKGTL